MNTSYINNHRMHTLQDFQAFFSIKPKGNNISPVKRLRQFISEYPDEDLTANLFRLDEEYKYYRAIHGDGNCFYRAIMFLYLREAELGNYERLFPPADLLTCRNLPFSNPRKLKSDNLLRYVWERFLQPLSKLSSIEREKELEKLFNTSANFDSILIAYFRALNYSYLLNHRAEFETFSYGGFEQDLERIITFGKESQGLQLLSLAQILEAQITVLMVHRQAYQKHIYNENPRPRRNYVVSYRPGHYDIPSNDEQYKKSQSSQKNSFSDYFSETNHTRYGQDSYTPGNSTPNKHNYTSSNLKSNYKPLAKQRSSEPPQIISIKNPSQLNKFRLTNVSESQKKKPLNMSSFNQSVVKRTNISHEKTESKVRLTSNSRQSKGLEQNSKVTKIRSSWAQNQQRQKRRKILTESSLCLVAIVLIIATALLL